MKTLHTNMYTDFSEKFFKSVLVEIRNRISAGPKRCRDISVVREPNGEVVLQTDDNSWNCLNNFIHKYSESDAKIWLTRNIKRLTVNAKSNIGKEWKRDNGAFNTAIYLEQSTEASVEAVLHPTIQQTYLIYELLAGRKNMERKYAADLIAEIQGHEKDALATEFEIAKRKEIEACKERYRPILEDLDPNNYRHKAYEDINDQCIKLREKLFNEWQSKFEEKQHEMENELAEINKLAAFATVSDFPFCA